MRIRHLVPRVMPCISTTLGRGPRLVGPTRRRRRRHLLIRRGRHSDRDPLVCAPEVVDQALIVARRCRSLESGWGQVLPLGSGYITDSLPSPKD